MTAQGQLNLQLARNYAAMTAERQRNPGIDQRRWRAEVAELEKMLGMLISSNAETQIGSIQ